jgi:coenzyme F420-reducing hydrogenase alpha subunit
MPIEGEIKISVVARSGQVESVSITSTRPLHITKLFAGKSIDSVADIMNAIYHLCNTAHRFAFLRLLDESTVIKLSQNEIKAYELLLDLETIREHCFSIASKWNQDAEATVNSNIINLLSTLKEINATLFLNTDPLSLVDKELQAFDSIEILTLKLEQQLQNLLLGFKCNAESVFKDINSFNNWLKVGKSQGATFLNYLLQHQLNKIGNIEVFHLPDLDPKNISDFLYNDAYIQQPNYQDITYETTPYSRQSNHQLIKQLVNINGNGVFTRAASQLLEVFELLNKVKCNYRNIETEIISYNFQFPVHETSALVQLEAARGRLVHQLSIKDEKIKSYQILAPTEWNFHPEGVLNHMIRSLNFTDKEDLISKVKLLVNAVDPCVGYSVEIDHA